MQDHNDTPRTGAEGDAATGHEPHEGHDVHEPHDTQDAHGAHEPPRAAEELTATAYAVLGILSVNGEKLSAGEIKQRTAFALRFFYSAPAVSHIRRELRRLLALGLVQDSEVSLGGSRRAQVFRITPEGESALRQWVVEGGDDTVTIKDPVLLRVFLGRGTPLPKLLSLLDARLGRVDEDIRDVVWGHRRAAEMGLIPHEDRRHTLAVSEYTLRALYFEQGNLRQLRDTLAGFDDEAFQRDDRWSRDELTFRPADFAQEPEQDRDPEQDRNPEQGHR
ncbi:hypothetical protein [Streptomyces sp. NRRL S-1868]|uniref:hypothetical protein n=1 Tax=Streptomyces sp. NRRL S-1868 TaxID=1463892 RepID=UPI00068C10B0|nr:hypothetical protein [Streptomyces sp. NRRL S-1868]